jgi:hypothetical protein
MRDTVFIGNGAGFAGDRFDAATPVVRHLAQMNGPRYLTFELLAERTLAIAQKLRRDNPQLGYSPFLDTYLRPVLAECKAHGIRIVSNMGAANPLAGARRVLALADELGVAQLKVAAVTGDDLLQVLSPDEIRVHPTIDGLSMAGREIVAANVYLGAAPIVKALAGGADVVLVGRCSDAALCLGPLQHEFGWASDDWARLAAGTLCGHLLECGAQVTGGYFADPGVKEVADLAQVGFPIAEVTASGGLVITKPEATGGCVTRQTVIEQILYEVHDPCNYLTPDVVLDLSEVTVREVGKDRVALFGAIGHAAPETLKATVCMDTGWLGEAEISYAGANARARAELAAHVLRIRCDKFPDRVRVDILGLQAIFDNDSGDRRVVPVGGGEYRVRAAVRSARRQVAQSVADEVLSLYCSGPAGGAGVRQAVTPQVGTASILVRRELVRPNVEQLRSA